MNEKISSCRFCMQSAWAAAMLSVSGCQILAVGSAGDSTGKSLIIDSHTYIWSHLYDICEWDFFSVNEYNQYLCCTTYFMGKEKRGWAKHVDGKEDTDRAG